jgi:ABC-type transporter Mla subunit MlaD
VSDFETAQKKRNLIVGIFVALAITVLFWMVIRFGDLPTFLSKFGSYPVFVQFPSAPGVQKDTPVRFCGYQVGKVLEVMPPRSIADRNTGLEYHQTVVVLSIDDQYLDIPSNIEVKLMSRGLGSSYIELKLDPTKPPKPIDPNRPITSVLHRDIWLQGSTGMSSEFFPEESQKKLEHLVDTFSVLLMNANDIIGDPNNKENIKDMLANLTNASGNVSTAIAKATKTIEKFGLFAETGTGTLKHTDNRIDVLVSSLVDTSGQLGKATVELRQVLHKINEGQGSAARLINDGKFYENLIENTEQLELLLTELKSFAAQARVKGIPLKLK